MKTRKLTIGDIQIGGGAPLSVQSMTNTKTHDVASTLSQITSLSEASCDIIRVAVPDTKALEALPEIIEKSPIPVVGDIHFDYRLALGAIESGIHGIRLNPGNIGDPDKVRIVSEAAGQAGIPIRVGSNSGSLSEEILKEVNERDLNPQDSIAEALIRSAVKQCEILEEQGFHDIKVSLKSPDVMTMINANRKFSSRYDYPLHLGVTEAGTITRGTIKSSIGIGTLLQEGIGDTIRVSLTADPVEEVKAGILILESLGLRKSSPEIVSCPTCGRTEIDLMVLAEKVEKTVEDLKASGININAEKIAVMGCVVNGPGEARDADLGIAGSKGGQASVFKNGKPLGMFPEDEAFEVLIRELRSL